MSSEKMRNSSEKGKSMILNNMHDETMMYHDKNSFGPDNMS